MLLLLMWYMVGRVVVAVAEAVAVDAVACRYYRSVAVLKLLLVLLLLLLM